MNNTRYILILKYTLYALLLLLLYILQTVPGLFVLFGTKPVLVVPTAISIAIAEGEFVGGIYGAAAGLLWDLGSFSLFGFHGLFLCFCCIGTGLLVIYLMHGNLRGCLLFVTIAMLMIKSVEFLFAYGMWGYENVWKIYVNSVLPTIAYTLVTAIPIYFLVRWLHNRMEALLTT